MVHLAPCPEKFLLRSSYVVRGLPRSTLPDFPSTAAQVRSAIALDQIIRRIRASATSGLQLIKRPSHGSTGDLRLTLRGQAEIGRRTWRPVRICVRKELEDRRRARKLAVYTHASHRCTAAEGAV